MYLIANVGDDGGRTRERLATRWKNLAFDLWLFIHLAHTCIRHDGGGSACEPAYVISIAVRTKPRPAAAAATAATTFRIHDARHVRYGRKKAARVASN